MRNEATKLFKQIKKHHSDGDVALVRKAYRLANQAHQGQARLSGDPYISHCIAVAQALSQIGLDVNTIAAGVLHDVLEDTSVTHAQLTEEFGEEIAMLVDGVSKIAAMHLSSPTLSQKEKQAENLRKMLIATAKDVRVIVIKLADRLHNMRTLEFLPPEKIARISRETLDIYAPMAHRLGIAQWRWELEDRAFHCLNPEEYKAMASKVAMKRREREAELAETIRFLEEKLAEAEVSAHVIGRPKHLYSIYEKMVAQGKNFDQVMDVEAVRIITQTVGDCYNALGLAHQIWTPVPGRFKDYVAMPKVNMYQSIHTTVMRANGQSLEVQIRSEEMDRTAREGIASHWKYKEGHTKADDKLDSQLKWLRQMYEWLIDAHAPEELLDSLRRDVAASDVFVFTPKGEVMELPEGATPLDFAYLIHTDVGHHCIGARVGGRIVPLTYNMQTGDVVEILTSKSQHPHLGWLEIVVTGKARTRIRQRLRDLGVLEPLDMPIEFEPEPQAPAPRRKVAAVDDETRSKMITVEGVDGIVVHFARCCNPMPGHPVIAYTTRVHGVTIHRSDCPNFSRTDRDPDRILAARWAGEKHEEVAMRVEAGQRPNILADITNAMRPLNVSITRAHYVPGDNGKSTFEFVFEAPDRESIGQVERNIRNVAGVVAIEILPSPEHATIA
jgi:GTP pyrophosphokinase